MLYLYELKSTARSRSRMQNHELNGHLSGNIYLFGNRNDDESFFLIANARAALLIDYVLKPYYKVNPRVDNFA